MSLQNPQKISLAALSRQQEFQHQLQQYADFNKNSHVGCDMPPPNQTISTQHQNPLRKLPDESSLFQQSSSIGTTQQLPYLAHHSGGNNFKGDGQGVEGFGKKRNESNSGISTGELGDSGIGDSGSGEGDADITVGSLDSEEVKMRACGSAMNFPSGLMKDTDRRGGMGQLEVQSCGSSEAKHTQRSTAEDWFNNLNRDVGGNNAFTVYDDDPPYYLPNVQRSRQPSLYRHPRMGRYLQGQGTSNFGKRTEYKTNFRGSGGALPDSTEESNSDSFRSVIDDLTIKNQKLKKRLKKLEGLQGGGLQSEKLFEVRIHGLPLSKKQELQKLLQQFASTLNEDDASNKRSSSGNSSSPRDVTPSTLPSTNQSSSPDIADSAYATNITSGSASLAPSSIANASGKNIKGHASRSSAGTNSGSSNSSPLSAIVSEKTKMKEVVKRLEQLFTGKKASSSHIHRMPPLMQSGISDDEDCEGTREASMLLPTQDTSTPKLVITPGSQGHAVTPGDLPDHCDQRPTRPIDLDPSRRQFPDENMEYLTNLTSSGGQDSAQLQGVGGGWVYLNLITNLAQLHTINVTPPFIKKAIITVSEKLELSHDGKMVRWKGGRDETQLSSDGTSRSGGSPSTSNGTHEQSDIGETSGKKDLASDSDVKDSSSVPPTPISGSGGRMSARRRMVISDPPSVEDKFHYKPLFARSGPLDDDSSDIDTTSSTSSPDVLKQDGSPGTKKRNITVDGPIIYYEGGNFCIDLTAQDVTREEQASSPEYPYERFTNNPIGEIQSSSESLTGKKDSPLFARGFEKGFYSSDGMQLDTTTDEEDTFSFSPHFTGSSPQTPPPPLELEASGIGGVLPEDNFAINVQTKHYLMPNNAKGIPLSKNKVAKTKVWRKIHHRIPKSSIDAFYEKDETAIGETNLGTSPAHSTASCSSSSDASSPPARNSQIRRRHRRFQPPIRHELFSTNTLKLPPSSLPPASYVFFTPSDESSSMDSDSGVAPHSTNSGGYFPRATAGNIGNADIYGNSGDELEFDGEVLVGPGGMRIFRRFMSTSGHSSGDGDEPGSSAATAGDASGYSSPAITPGAVILDDDSSVKEGRERDDRSMEDPWSEESEPSGPSQQYMLKIPSALGIPEGDFEGKDRPTLKRSRGSGTSSESFRALAKKNARKWETSL
ncbi:hypothetical protein RUND412_008872 [Rhizina undulata]